MNRFLRSAAGVIALVVAAALVAIVGVFVAMLVAGEPLDGPSAVLGVVGATALGAVGWPWARRLIGSSIDRLVRGLPRSPEDVMRAFGQSAGRHTPTVDLLQQLAESLLRSMQASSVEIWQHASDGELVRSVAIPQRPSTTEWLDDGARRVLAGGGVVGRAWLQMWWPSLVPELDPGDVRIVPATHAGELLAVVIVTRAADRDRFRPSDDAELAEIGGRLGLVLHNRQLDAALQDTLEDLQRTNSELRASRVRLVATADAERRRLERNLHDGAQQHLVALAVDLRLAAEEIAADPSVARARFAELGDEVKEAIAELRVLAHGIYPPLLMDSGLVEALRVSARRSASPVVVRAESVGRYSPEVEAAAYFCCMEALQNASKHAAGAAVRIELSERDGALHLVVDDDGPGFDPAAVQPGQGLVNMRDRIGAAGGSLSVDRNDAGGTRVTAVLPVTGR